jgi:drug/metabolite transporter (DMT)-like permease
MTGLVASILNSPYIPLALVFLSGLGFSIQSIIIKFLSEDGLAGVNLTVFCRGFVQLLVSVYYVHAERKQANERIPLCGSSWYVSLLLFLRSTFGFVSTIMGFMAIEYLPVGDASVLIMLSSIIGGIMGVVLLKEACQWPQTLATFVSLLGGIFICRPTFLIHALVFMGFITSSDSIESANALGITLGLSAAVCSSVAFIMIRMLGTTSKMPWCYVTFAQAVGQIVLSLPEIFLRREKLIASLNQHKFLLIFTAGFIGTWSQIAMTIGMQREKSATAIAMRMSDILFGFTWQALFTADEVSLLSVFGAMLVVSSVMILVAFKSSEVTAAATIASASSILANVPTDRKLLFNTAMKWMTSRGGSRTPHVSIELTPQDREDCQLIDKEYKADP